MGFIEESSFIFLAVLLAYFVKGITGFGSGLIAMPLIALAFPDMRSAVPVLALTELFASLYTFWGLRGTARLENQANVLVGVLAGVIAGCGLLWILPAIATRKAFGGFLLFFAVKLYYGMRASRGWTEAMPDFLRNFIGGLFTGLFASGRVLVAGGLRKRFAGGEELRAALASVFFAESLAQNILYAGLGLTTFSTFSYLLAGLPALAVAILLSRITPEGFNGNIVAKALAPFLAIAGFWMLLARS